MLTAKTKGRRCGDFLGTVHENSSMINPVTSRIPPVNSARVGKAGLRKDTVYCRRLRMNSLNKPYSILTFCKRRAMLVTKSQVKYIQSLGHKKFRDAEGVFLVEGPKIVGELLQAPGMHLRALYGV